MRNKILLLIVIILSIIYFSIEGSKNTTFFSNGDKKIVVKNTKTNETTKMNLEDYIVGVVAAEMPASFNEEALKAQAIASRTYAVYKMGNNKNYDVVTDVSNQGYIDIDEMKEKWNNDFNKYYEKIKDAVLSTKGQVMYYDGKVIASYYFAMSNGYTENAKLVFNEDRDYLQSVSSIYDNESLKNFIVKKELSKEEVCKSLNIECNNLNISNIIRSDTGRVNNIRIGDKDFKGTEIRKLLKLRSTDFTIEEESDKWIITTKGYGHGVGMSQYGANGMAKEGKTFEEILEYYYKNIEIALI